ncbi:MAG: helix-turn-helix transcriptional regulator [Clostridia bacterium]|nr:helix-turn-helix transcriptional regulator [Clostridia bacterium]
MITMEQIKSKLAQAVEQSEKTKSEIAAQIGVKESALLRYVYGNTKPSLKTFAKLCIALDLDANDILCLTE